MTDYHDPRVRQRPYLPRRTRRPGRPSRRAGRRNSPRGAVVRDLSAV